MKVGRQLTFLYSFLRVFEFQIHNFETSLWNSCSGALNCAVICAGGHSIFYGQMQQYFGKFRDLVAFIKDIAYICLYSIYEYLFSCPIDRSDVLGNASLFQRALPMRQEDNLRKNAHITFKYQIYL